MHVVDVGIEFVHPLALVPKYETAGAAGFDIASVDEDFDLQPGETKLIATGIKVAVPRGYELQIRPRSGLSLKTDLHMKNSPGTIDSDYRGEVGIIVANRGHTPISIPQGTRVAQGVIAPVFQARFVIGELDATERGEGGFGHTGLK